RGASILKVVCLVAVPERVKALEEAHRDVDINTAALEERLNEDG
ncbi:uracil phosphoribosyltransferase, partial [Enterococcus faecalis]